MIRYNVEREGDRYYVGVYRVSRTSAGESSEFVHRIKDESGNNRKFTAEGEAQEYVNKLTREMQDDA